MIPKRKLEKKVLNKKPATEQALNNALDVFNKYDSILNGMLVCKDFETLMSFLETHDKAYDECKDALMVAGYTETEAVKVLDDSNRLFLMGWLSDHPSEYDKLMAWLSS